MVLTALSREITHRLARLPNHPTLEVFPFSTHEEKRVVAGSPIRAVAWLDA
jgi:hypothetical protein